VIESCLVEIARRECNQEPGHRQTLATKSSHDDLSDDAAPSPAEEEPCESHYLKAKEAYSAIMENMGCICRLLISLNLDTRCSTRRVGSLHSNRSGTSLSRSRLGNLEKSSSSRSLCKPQIPVSCHKDCCSSSASSKSVGASGDASTEEKLMTSTEMKDDDYCCDKSYRSETTSIPPSKTTAGLEATSDGGKTSPCCAVSPPMIGMSIDSQILISKSNKCCTTGYYDKNTAGQSIRGRVKNTECCSSERATPYFPRKVQDSHISLGSSDAISDHPSGPATIKPKQISMQTCCAAERTYGTGLELKTKDTGTSATTRPSLDCCIGDAKVINNGLAQQEKLACTDTITPILVPLTPGTTSEVDLENDTTPLRHVILSVQGMTCTGCEKKLYRSLDVLPELSNIKTSLLLAQAEFDLREPTHDINIVNTIKTIEKMTGFTCTRMTQSEHELDLIVDGSASNLINKDLPFGVSDIAVLDPRTIRITYHPKLVGARDLVSDPFFQSSTIAPVTDRPLIASGKAHVSSMLFKTIICALLTLPVLILAWAPIPEHPVIYGAVSLVLATIVQVYVAGPWYASALSSLFFSRLIEMDLLVVLSTTTAYIYSIIAFSFLVVEKPLSTESFFETSTLLVTLIMLGRLVSGFARQRAVESISMESLQSSTAILIDPETQQDREIDSRLLQYRDIFKALPDTSIVTDGIVITGMSEVDESMITGEATLVVKSPGSQVVAGSINHSSTLTIQLTRLPAENTIKAIGLMVDEAKSSKTKIQEIADSVATYFIPAIFITTTLIFIIWIVVGKVSLNYGTTTTCINAMTYAISALIVSCPCAIGLAVPMVLVVAGGVAAKNGLIFKTAQTIEIARKLSHVVFDKTGTLTQGSLAMKAEMYPTGQRETIAPMLLGLTGHSKHPVSTAIATLLKVSGFQAEKVDDIISIAGCGIEGKWNGKKVRAGNPYWLGLENSLYVREMLQLGVTMFCVMADNELVAVYGLKDLLRPEAISVINQLKKRSVEVSVVSGDNEQSVRSVARSLNIPETHIRFRCSPADKQEYVKQILANPKSVVMFCGDGTNDAVALAQATIGMHIHGGTDIAQSAADAVLVRPVLGGIIVLMDLSKAFFNRVVFNFTWSFIYNTFAILLAAGAFPNARIAPQFAGLGEIVSVLPVIAIGMQLKWVNFSQAE
jgi:heavy metal translocating P-type ATPase